MARSSTHEVQKTCSPLKKLRLKAKLSQQQLATDTGVAVSTIRRWEKGQTEPTMTVLQMKSFCNSLQITLDNLPNSLRHNNLGS